MATSYVHGVKASQRYIDDGTVRALFKVYFVVFVILIGIVGDLACRLTARSALLRGRAVTLTATTGWIHGPSFVKATFQLRRIPCGWLGWLMLVATVIDLTADFGVAKTVTSVPITSTTYWPQGMVVSNNTKTTKPSTQWQAFSWATLAQVYNSANAERWKLGNSRFGIYRFVHNDTNFLANNDDIIGYWNCSQTSEPITYNQTFKGNKTEIYDVDIWQDLAKRHLMSGDSAVTANATALDKKGIAYGPVLHSTILSSSTTAIGYLFNVTAAVDTADLDIEGSKEIATWRCVLVSTDANKTVEQIARGIDISSVLAEWVTTIQGSLFPGLYTTKAYSLPVIKNTLELYLNAMIMVAGADETLTSPNTQKWRIGTYTFATLIPYWVIIVSSIIFAIALLLACYCLYLYLSIRKAQRTYEKHESQEDCNKVSAKEIADNTPIGLMDWMTHAAYESRDVDKVPEHKQLKYWILSTTWHGNRRLGIVKEDELGQTNPLRRQTTSPGSGSSFGTPANVFESSKGQPPAIATKELPELRL